MLTNRIYIARNTIFTHLLFWALYVASEYFANLMHLHPGNNWPFFRTTLLTLPILVIATYFMALFAVPRFLQANRWGWFWGCAFVAAAFIFFSRVKWLEFLNYLQYQTYDRIPPSKLLKNIIRDYATVALGVCIYIIGDYRKKQQLNEQLAKAKAEVEIKLLKGQLHPHFLFNSLNNIYSLALMKSDLTADSILKLTELLDYLVYRVNLEQVPLVKEVQLLDNYIGLEQLRYGEKLKVESQISVQSESIKVAPLLLLPFAENCFKHGGVGPNGFFCVKLELKANHQKLWLHITNSKKKKKEDNNGSGGVGLENIRKRLTLLYPGRHQLEISNLPDQYKVVLQIQFLHESQS